MGTEAERLAEMDQVRSVAPRGDLRSLLDSCMEESSLPIPMPLWLRMRMLHGISLAVRHAHAHLPNAIVHRDLQPRSIVVASDWTARVTEWGFASGAGESSGEIGEVSPYTPPEVLAIGMGIMYGNDANEEPLPRDGWSRKGDVYSFGVLAWEVMGGNKPWITKSLDSALGSLEICDQVVAQKMRPHGKAHDIALTVTGSQTETGMPLLACEAANRASADPKAKQTKLIAAIEESEMLKLVVQCWNADHNARPTMEEVNAVLTDTESELRKIGWGEDSWQKTMSAHASSSGAEMDSILGAVEGAADGRASTSAVDVAALLAKHKKLAQEAKQKALEESENKRHDSDDDEDDINADAGIDLTASFANFYKGAFDHGDNDEDREEEAEEETLPPNLAAV